MKMNSRWKRTGALCMAAVLLGNVQMGSGAGLVTGFAAGGSVTPIAQYDGASMEKFADHVLEYWEIPGLIEHYNPTYLNALETYNYNPDGSTGLSKDQLTALASSFRFEAENLEAEMEERLEDGELEKDSAAHEDYKENIKTLKKKAREMETALKGSTSMKRTLRTVRNRLTLELSAKMREYHTLVSDYEIQKKNLEIAEGAVQIAKRQYELGMYSAVQVRTAEQTLETALAQTAAAEVSLVKTRSDLISAFGWGYDAEPEILEIPSPDLEKIAGYQPEADLEQAVSYSYEVADVRATAASEYGGAKKKVEKIEETENSVRMQMELLYQTVQAKLENWNGSLLRLESADSTKAQAERKYSLGMISRQEFLQAEADWLTAKAAGQKAAFDLIAAMETYEMAVSGLIVKNAPR